jgi:hypothetical protein
LPARFTVHACPRCKGRRSVEEGRKTAQCPRCGAVIDVRAGTPLFGPASLEDVQAFLGGLAAREANAAPPGPAPAPARSERERERARIALALGGASGRANQLKLLLRRGFEACGELTAEDLDSIARQSDLGLTGEELADGAVELGLAGRSPAGSLVPLREGR